MSIIKVIGHTPPDTDSVCSPMAYAWFLKSITGKDAKAYVGGELNKETKYVLDRFGFDTPERLESLGEGDNVVIMDTNNPTEILAGLDKSHIVRIIDHHKLTEITTPNPVSITIRPVASVSTILWDMWDHIRDQIPEDIAGLMLSAIVSDTLNFTSPTTTKKDKIAAAGLAVIADVDPNELAQEMFAAKSDLSGMGPLDIVLADYKNYTIAKKNYVVGVLETTAPSQALDKKENLIEAMNRYKEENELEGILLFIVDILEGNSHLVIAGDTEENIAEEAFEVEVEDDIAFLEGVVSRKKQIVPAMEEYLNQ